MLVVSGKKKVTISLQRGTVSGISSQSSAVLIYKREKKKKKKKWIFIFFPCIKQGIIRAPVGATKKSGRQGAMWNYRIKTSCVVL